MLPPHDLASVARLNVSISHEHAAYIRRAFRMDRLLVPFFASYSEFRELQSRTGTLISGSTALQFFDRVSYPEADLDLYVGRLFAGDVVAYVRDKEGYKFEPTGRQARSPEVVLESPAGHPGYDLYAGTGISDVLNFRRDAKHVQIITRTSAPMDVIFNYHSSKCPHIEDHCLSNISCSLRHERRHT